MSCQHYGFSLQEEHRHYVKSEEHNNCVLCLINQKGAMSQEEIGKYLNLTKMRISHIQKVAIKKLFKKMKFCNDSEKKCKTLKKVVY